MEKYVLGIDLGTSSVKVILVNNDGKVVAQEKGTYDLIQEKAGYSEQNPEDWVISTIDAMKKVIDKSKVDKNKIEGVSYSGQMHGLILLDEENNVLRPAILWNDTRTTEECEKIKERLGSKFISITKNTALEGFTLPKLLWVKKNESNIWKKTTVFLLPKDYLRYRMTNNISTDYSDATGTVLMDIREKKWSKELCNKFDIPLSICPPIVNSTEFVGNISAEFSKLTGLPTTVKVFAGAGDNAAGALGSGILSSDTALVSVGTSGVVLNYENNISDDYHGQLQFENYINSDSYYSMGVTLSAGYSLDWFKRNFYSDKSFNEMIEDARKVEQGAKGLFFTPYIMGERTPYANATIRGSFIGVDARQSRADFTRAVMEGITFSFKDILNIYKKNGKSCKRIISIGGGAKSAFWLQMQADIFNTSVISLDNEGPSLGAAMIAAVGLGWFNSISECAKTYIKYGKEYTPDKEKVAIYKELYDTYHLIYNQTKLISNQTKKVKIC